MYPSLHLLTHWRKAVCDVHRDCVPTKDTYLGRVHFEELSDGMRTEVEGFLSGLTPGLHGLHIHEVAVSDGGCNKSRGHYNPYKSTHGGSIGEKRHRGDLGNIESDRKGVCTFRVVADVRVSEILGRQLIVHAGEDDLGRGGDAESLATGNAGKRVGGGTIKPFTL
jgi:Cu/Zn superoxide dismutase